MKLLKPFLLITLSFVVSFYIIIASKANTLSQYINSGYLDNIPFGSHSHWIQPWRAYLETIPAQKFLDGIGVVWNIQNSVGNPEIVAQMLAKHGFTRVRLEIGWNHLDYDDEAKFVSGSEEKFKQTLLALKKNNIRPLILLNSHHNKPCPARKKKYTVLRDTYAGSTQIELNDARGLRANYSGLSKLHSRSWAAEYLITDISDNVITISKPLPIDLKFGESIDITTLKYRPFSKPNSKYYAETIAGWKQYLATVTNFVKDTLNTQTSGDKGFDLEIWNELTFGSNFLYINKYYEPDFDRYEAKSIWENLVRETASYVDAHHDDFLGVEIGNGFSSTIPWLASSQQPLRIDALCKHPYKNRVLYPEDEKKSQGLNALLQEDSWIPTYSAFFPEYSATALQTETILRDAAPVTTKISRQDHGRFARVIDGNVVPTPVWITEVNLNLLKDNPLISAENALEIKAKAISRYFCFYLNKGVTRIYIFAVGGLKKNLGEGDKSLGILQANFLEYAKKDNLTYPLDEELYASLALKVLSRIVDKMSVELDRNLTQTDSLSLTSVTDRHDNYQFQGDGSKEHPNLYDRDVFAFLPFQVNQHKFVIPYYVMTRDIMKDLIPEKFTLEVEAKELEGELQVEAYDPISDTIIPVEVKQQQRKLTLTVTATDYPCLLTIKEK